MVNYCFECNQNASLTNGICIIEIRSCTPNATCLTSDNITCDCTSCKDNYYLTHINGINATC
jgi:hypothetical protein